MTCKRCGHDGIIRMETTGHMCWHALHLGDDTYQNPDDVRQLLDDSGSLSFTYCEHCGQIQEIGDE